MPSLAGPISAARARMTITVTRTGRIRPPNLPDLQLKAIGLQMVLDQKARWAAGVNADGIPAKKLSVRYAIIKQAVLHKRPKRDMTMTGRTVANFQLRKAANGIIRAENTTKLERQKCQTVQLYDQMIGFSLSDAKNVFQDIEKEFGKYVGTAWIPLDGTTRRPSAFTPPAVTTP